MKKILAVLLMIGGFSAAGFSRDIFGARLYDFTPPPYEISLWGTGGILFGNFNVNTAANPNYQLTSTDVIRTSWGFDFMFRIWILGLGFEYSSQMLEKMNLNATTIPITDSNYTLNSAYFSRFADAIQLKAKVELFNIIVEAGIGFYIPRTGLYQDMTFSDGATNYNELWTKTSTAVIDPKMIISFGVGYPMVLSDSMDIIPYLRLNLFTAEEAISIGNLRNLATYESVSTIDIGAKLRIAFQ